MSARAFTHKHKRRGAGHSRTQRPPMTHHRSEGPTHEREHQGTMLAGDTLEEHRQQADTTSQYSRHDRYWIPLNHPGAERFYMEHLFVPHSRRELARKSLSRVLPWIRPAAMHPAGAAPPLFGAEAAGAGITFDDLSRLLETELRQAGLATTGPVALLALEDYPGSSRRQTVVFVFDGQSATPRAVAKLAPWMGEGTRLAAEFKALAGTGEHLDQALRQTVPKPLALTHHKGMAVLLETHAAGRSLYVAMRGSWFPRLRAGAHFRAARGWLVSFQRATTSASVTLNDEIAARHVLAPLARFRRDCEPSAVEQRMLEHTLSLARELRDQSLPLVARQGDFWPRNLVVDGERICVVDWERFEPRSLPFSDLFMFPIAYGLSYPWKPGRWARPADAFHATCIGRSSLSGLVRAYLREYCAEMGLSPRLLELFLPVFLVEKALEERASTQNDAPGQAPRIWRELLRTYAEHGGSFCVE